MGNRAQHCALTSGIDQMIFARQFYQLRARYAAGEVTGFVDMDIVIVDPMHHEGGNSDRRQHLAHVDQSIHTRQRQCGAGRGAASLISCPPATKSLVVAISARPGLVTGGLTIIPTFT